MAIYVHALGHAIFTEAETWDELRAYESGEPSAVIVPIEIWREIESERETAYLLKTETMSSGSYKRLNVRPTTATNPSSCLARVQGSLTISPNYSCLFVLIGGPMFSRMGTTRSAATSRTTVFSPDGQRTVIESATVALPRPKCSRMSFCER